MPQIFENPFTPPEKKPKKSLFGEDLGIKRRLDKKGEERIKDTERKFQKIKYGEMEILGAQVEFLENIEKQLIEAAKKEKKELSQKQAREILLKEISPGFWHDELRFEVDEQGNITKLNLDDLKLTLMPKSISQLKNLQVFRCNKNQLNELPSEIGKLINLQKFSCAYNNFTKLPAKIGKLINLQNLNCINNKLTSLPKEIENLTKLEYLSLVNNQLSDQEKAKIKKKFTFAEV